MASTQLSPGVVVLERDLTNVVNATVDNVAAIVGSFEKGPVEQITSITSEQKLLAIFGRPNEYNYEYWFALRSSCSTAAPLSASEPQTLHLKTLLILHSLQYQPSALLIRL